MSLQTLCTIQHIILCKRLVHTKILTKNNTKEAHEEAPPCTIFCRASTAKVSPITKIGFLVITLETDVSSGLRPSAITRVATSCNQTLHLEIKFITYVL